MRGFIAINLDETLKGEVSLATKGLRRGNWDVKWVAIGNLHITLKFLGDVPDESVDRIKGLLKAISPHHMPFVASLRGVGVFPDRKRPRVVWIDILNPEKLQKLQAEIEDNFITIGYDREDRHFSPHLTIGRIRSIDARHRESFITEVESLRDMDFGNIEVRKIYLMKSDLKPTGAQYSIVAEFPLSKEEQ